MKRLTFTIPDDLEAFLEEYFSEQDTPPSFTTLVQTALREYILNERLRERGYQPPQEPFHVEPLEEKDDQGEPDVSINHDAYFGKP